MTEQTSTSVEQAAPRPGTPEHDAAMLAVKASAREDNSNPLESLTADSKPTRPENVPEKFWNPETGAVDVENLLKSYTELESGRGQKGDETETQGVDDTKTKEVVEASGLDWSSISAKVAETGDIEEADYVAFEAKGIPRDLVKEHIGLRKAQFEQEQARAIEYAGGAEAVEKLLGWASQNLPPKDIEGYNEMLAGPHWRVAIDALKARVGATAKTAAEPKLAAATTSLPSSTTGYTSRDDMTADMRNPLYHDRTSKGEAFRAQVMQRAAASAWNRK